MFLAVWRFGFLRTAALLHFRSYTESLKQKMNFARRLTLRRFRYALGGFGVLYVGYKYKRYQLSKKLPDEFNLVVDLQKVNDPESSFLDIITQTPENKFLQVLEALFLAESDPRISKLFVTTGNGVNLTLAEVEDLRESVKTFNMAKAFLKRLQNEVEAKEANQEIQESSSEKPEESEDAEKPEETTGTEEAVTTEEAAMTEEAATTEEAEEEKSFSFFYSPSFDSSSGLLEYYLASSFEHISMSKAGMLDLSPLSAVLMNISGLIDKVGVEAEVFRKHEYKTAMNMFLPEGITKEERESMERIVSSLMSNIKEGLADDSRAIDLDQKEVFSKEFTAEESVAEGFVDSAESLAMLTHKRVPEGSQYVDFDTYLTKRKKEMRSVPCYKVGLLSVSGEIAAGDSLGHSSVVFMDGLDKAIRDDKTFGMLVRVDSPGGEVTLSENYFHAMEEFTKNAKSRPLVVSMGSLAASGGYMLSLPANMLANPSTITGSIGVIGGKPHAGLLLEKMGVQVETIGAPGYDQFTSFDMEAIHKKWSDVQLYVRSVPVNSLFRERMDKKIDKIYAKFVGMVSSSRGIELEELDKLARGRIWTGKEAESRNLVDGIGGFRKSLSVMAHLVNEMHPQTQNAHMYIVPIEKNGIAQLVRELLGLASPGRDSLIPDVSVRQGLEGLQNYFGANWLSSVSRKVFGYRGNDVMCKCDVTAPSTRNGSAVIKVVK